MDTKMITGLCRLSETISTNAEKAAEKNTKETVKKITIVSGYRNIELYFNEYPELKPVAEKVLDYLVKSEESKQNEIKIEIAKLL